MDQTVLTSSRALTVGSWGSLLDIICPYVGGITQRTPRSKNASPESSVGMLDYVNACRVVTHKSFTRNGAVGYHGTG
jgi:hypothetical protein